MKSRAGKRRRSSSGAEPSPLRLPPPIRQKTLIDQKIPIDQKTVIDLTKDENEENKERDMGEVEEFIEEPSCSDSDGEADTAVVPAPDSSSDDDGDEMDAAPDGSHPDDDPAEHIDDDVCDAEPAIHHAQYKHDEKPKECTEEKTHDKKEGINEKNGKLFQPTRSRGPSVLTPGQYDSVQLVIDIAEHSFNLEVKEVIRLGDHVLKHGYDCCHPNSDGPEPSSTVFKCADCGFVAETLPKVWDEAKDVLSSKAPRIKQLIQTFLEKPIDHNF